MSPVRAADIEGTPPEGDGRSVDVRLVPWDVWAEVSDDGRARYRERFRRGGLELGRQPLLVRDGHSPAVNQEGVPRPLLGNVIGHIAAVEDRPDGAHATLRIAETPEGLRTLALVRNGTTRAVSIEFSPLEDAADAPGQVTRVRARLDGVAFAPHAAHDSPILAVRQEPAVTIIQPELPIPAPAPAPVAAPPAVPVPPAPAPAVAPPSPPAAPPVVLDEGARARAAAATLAGATAPPSPAVVRAGAPFESLGHFVRAVAAHDPVAETFARALAVNITSENTGVVPPSWVGEVFGLVAAARPTWAAFRSRPLPPTGMTINYPTVTSRPDVDKQATEKTEIASNKFTIAPTGTPVETFAGGENVSLQLALRSDPSYVDALWRAFAMEYAGKTNTAFIANMASKIAQTVTVAGTAPAVGTAAAWWAAFVAGAGMVMRGAYMPPDVVVMSTDVWELLAGFVDTDGRPIFPTGINGPSNAAGQTALSGPGNLGGIRWIVDPWAPTDFAAIAWSGAAELMESPGAPLRLEANEPSILGKEVAVYGFVATAFPWPLGIARILPPALAAQARTTAK